MNATMHTKNAQKWKQLNTNPVHGNPSEATVKTQLQGNFLQAHFTSQKLTFSQMQWKTNRRDDISKWKGVFFICGGTLGPTPQCVWYRELSSMWYLRLINTLWIKMWLIQSCACGSPKANWLHWMVWVQCCEVKDWRLHIEHVNYW